MANRDDQLPEYIQSIRDPNERMQAIERLYKQQNVQLGESVTSALFTGAQILTPKAPVAIFRTFRNVSNALDAARNRDTLEELAWQDGRDIHSGPRRRHIAWGSAKAVPKNLF